MGNLKYNPLLKLNLQEETSAEDVLGDGYNEKILTGSDFIQDMQNNVQDTGIVRQYFLTNNLTIPYNVNNGNVNFSCEIFCNNYDISLGNGASIKFNGKKTIIHDSPNAAFFGMFLLSFYGKTLILDNIRLDCALNSFNIFQNYCNIFLINCTIKNRNASQLHFVRNVKANLFIFNLKVEAVNTNNIYCNYSNCIFLYSDGSAIANTNVINMINIDSALDLNSRGLLPNSVITAALNNLQPDSTLDANSNKPVMNSAVTTEINQITQIVENFQDINVSNLTEFENAIQTGQTANVRIHLTTDITLTQSVTYNLDKIQIYGHDNKINLENYTFTIQGETCYFNQLRFNANSSVNANTAANYSNAQINIISTANSTRYFFEYIIFLNFVCKSSDNSNTDYVSTFIDVQNGSGLTYPSLHLYFTYCEIMTNYMQSNINNLCAAVNHSGSLHALTVHIVDFWGNNKEDNSCPNWTFTGNTLSGLAKLGWISDGSAIYEQRTNSLTPSFVNQYNPSTEQFTTLQNKVDNIFALQHRTVSNSGSYSGGTFTASANIYYNSAFAFVYYNITTTASSTQPENIVFLDLGLTLTNSFYQVVANPPTEQDFKILVEVNGKIYNVYAVPYIPYEGRGQFFVNLVQS